MLKCLERTKSISCLLSRFAAAWQECMPHVVAPSNQIADHPSTQHLGLRSQVTTEALCALTMPDSGHGVDCAATFAMPKHSFSKGILPLQPWPPSRPPTPAHRHLAFSMAI